MILIVDTNVVFSAILNERSRSAKILIQNHRHFSFYASDFLRSELKKLFPRIAEIGKKSISEIERIENLVTTHITFLDHELIPGDIVRSSYQLTKDVDPDDTIFIVLAVWLKGKLWSGDKKLLKGLKNKGFHEVITTEELLALINRIETGESET